MKEETGRIPSVNAEAQRRRRQNAEKREDGNDVPYHEASPPLRSDLVLLGDSAFTSLLSSLGGLGVLAFTTNGSMKQ
jgi:hypothetical protein